MCAITSLVLTVCWFPTEVCYIINQYGFSVFNFGTPFLEFTVLLALANSFANPWIYAVSYRRYRDILTLGLGLGLGFVLFTPHHPSNFSGITITGPNSDYQAGDSVPV